GGASGIGRACAARLAGAGAKVVIADVDGPGAAGAAAEIGGEVRVVDLADPDAVDALDVAADVIVNNAGVQHVAPLEEFPPERFSYLLRVMLEAPFRVVRACLPGMYARGYGRVVTLSSVHGLRASPYKAAYVAAMHGLDGLANVVALEGGPRGV